MTISLLVLTILPFQIWMMLSPEKAKKLWDSMMTDEQLFKIAFFHVAAALIILSFAGLNFKFKWENTLSFIGLLSFIKGIFFLFCPDCVKAMMKKIVNTSFQGAIFFSILVDVALIYIDTKLI